MHDPFDFTGKVVFIGGAGNVGNGIGNGKAMAIQFARRGASVFGVDIVPEAVEETRALIAAEGGIFHAHTANLTDSASVEAAFQACAERFGGVDAAVNNVGGSFPGGAAEMSEEDFERQLNFNLKSAFLGCKHAIPHLLARGGGAIVNLASIVAIRMNEERPLVGYAASKQAVIGLSRSVAVQHAARGIRCNTLIPGLINTPLVEERLTRQGGKSYDELVAARNAQVPMGKMGSAWDVANGAVFLASQAAAHVTGTELLVDGGIATRMA